MVPPQVEKITSRLIPEIEHPSVVQAGLIIKPVCNIDMQAITSGNT